MQNPLIINSLRILCKMCNLIISFFCFFSATLHALNYICYFYEKTILLSPQRFRIKCKCW